MKRLSAEFGKEVYFPRTKYSQMKEPEAEDEVDHKKMNESCDFDFENDND